MENSPEESTAAEAAVTFDQRQPEQQPVRRRMVQSTLFPRRPPQDNAVDKEDVENCDDEEVGDAEEEEYCGSQGKKKKKTSRKPRTSSRKVAVNGKQTLNMRLIDKESSATAKPTLLSELSESPQQEQRCIGSQKEIDGSCSPLEFAPDMKSPQKLKRRKSSTPKSKQLQTTPRKKILNGSIKGTCLDQISDNTLQSGSVIQVPDLRLEEKMKAEENARVFGGRKLHPFFSSCKAPKKNQETIDVDSWCSVDRKDRSAVFSPIHVFEMVKDVAGSLDWGNWIFSEKSVTGTNYDCLCSPVYEGSVKSLRFDDFLSSSSSRVSLLQNKAIQHDQVSLDPSSFREDIRPGVMPFLSADEPVVHCEPLKDITMNLEDHEIARTHFLSENLTHSDAKWEDGLYGRMMTYYQGSGKHIENSLWTDKFVPEKAIEVCGNCESVIFLSEWLHLWHEKGFRSSNDIAAGEEILLQGDDYNCYESDCESENRDEANRLKNVLLVTGPVGSGKSAAIYACAKEQGFHVIEVNASDWRTRTLVMQRFGGGVESYWVQRAVGTPIGSESKCTPLSLPDMSNTTTAQGADFEVTELITPSDEEDLLNVTETPEKFVCKENKIAPLRSESKPLILFEDVDAILSEDHGLIATIQKLAETAKRPIILTSNSCNLVLPNNLDRHELCFAKPSAKELFYRAYTVCAAEKSNIQPHLVERFIGCCQGDIRKTFMHLQFWCQGSRSSKDGKGQRKYGPYFYDVDAGHRILPKIIPWGYPSQLSEIVEKDVTLSLLNEESSKLREIAEEGLSKKMLHRPKRQKPENDSIYAKKEAILRSHFPNQDGNEFSCQFTTQELSSSSGSPVAFTRRNVRRKLDTVLSSDSECEGLNDRIHIDGAKLFEDNDNEEFLEVDCKTSSYCLETEMCSGPVSELLVISKGEKCEESFNPLSEPLLNTERNEFQENGSECLETAVRTQINGTYNFIDISCAPELSFVPETEINDGTLPASNDLMEITKPIDTSNLLVSWLKRNTEMVKDFGIKMESPHGEEVGDSHNEHVETVPRGHQAMDECSRMDFSRGAQCKDKPRSSIFLNSVQETWRRIRGCQLDMRQYVTSGERDASLVLKLACEMTNLISEADMLLGDCQPLICDTLEPSRDPPEKSHSFSWHDDHLWMISTIAQHGICFYTNKIAALRSDNTSVNTMDLSWEMLASSTDTMALGKLVSQDKKIQNLEMTPSESVISRKSEVESQLSSVIQSFVPSRSILATKRDALHEYLSALGKISRSEISRLSENIDKTKPRRVRVARNYLSTGAMTLSPDDISLLGQYSCYRKVSSLLGEQG